MNTCARFGGVPHTQYSNRMAQRLRATSADDNHAGKVFEVDDLRRLRTAARLRREIEERFDQACSAVREILETHHGEDVAVTTSAAL